MFGFGSLVGCVHEGDEGRRLQRTLVSQRKELLPALCRASGLAHSYLQQLSPELLAAARELCIAAGGGGTGTETLLVSSAGAAAAAIGDVVVGAGRLLYIFRKLIAQHRCLLLSLNL